MRGAAAADSPRVPRLNPGTPRPCRQFWAALTRPVLQADTGRVRYVLMVVAVLAGLVIAVAGAYALGLRNRCEGDSCDSTTWVVFGCVSIVGGLLIVAGGLYAGLSRDE
jgi:hypothetical protein